uniref:Transposable element P transposase-like GTP-binding insertion domain-containing protein n=1 Tax=Ciona intestinalis TaxID=7719 RepID=F6PZY2_CIOIN
MKHLRPSKFEKTNIDLAAQVFSRTTGSAIKTLVGQQVLSQEALSTAFFCDYFNNWFDLMSSTSCENSLFKDSTEKIQFLLEVKDMVDNMEFGNVKTSKVPVQTGIQLSTLSIISMHEELVKGGNLDFFLTSRFMQDSLENLLSQIHGFRNPNPRPGRFLSTLKLILLAQFMQIPPFLSY